MKHYMHALQATQQTRTNTEEKDGTGKKAGKVVEHRERE